MKISPDKSLASKRDCADINSEYEKETKDDKVPRLTQNWGKVRMATRTMTALNKVKLEIKTVGKELKVGDNFEEEIKAKVKKKWFILLPKSRFRRIWEGLIVILLMYIMIAVPIRVGFDVSITSEHPIFYFDIVIDLIFLTDVILNCFSAYLCSETGDLIVDMKKILQRYLHTWFFIDMIASIPFSIFLDSRYSFVKLLRLLKLLRVLRLKRYWNMLEYHLGVSIMYTRLFKVFFGVFLATHLVGCTWYYTSLIDLTGKRIFFMIFRFFLG